MQLFSQPEDCCGCTACMNICPRDAISMKPDEKGFLYPYINPQLCVDCGMCRKVCPIQTGCSVHERLGDGPYAYAAKHRNDAVRMNSTSGGMFTAVSDDVLGRGGTIYGAAFNENLGVCHQRAETQKERNRFRGSKYVQSDLGSTFRQVKDDLASGREVLFSGTPCQTAGLADFLDHSRIDMSGLYLCDLICHGTPSPQIWKDDLRRIRSKYHSEATDVDFRYKPSGWKQFYMKVQLKSGRKVLFRFSEEPFYCLFSSNIILRPSCYQCPFTNFQRPSDLTVGDFWGIENTMPDFEDEKGVSLLLVNSFKGRRLVESVKDRLILRQCSLQDCIQQNLKAPSPTSPKVKQFWDDYAKVGFQRAAERAAPTGFRRKSKDFAKKVLQTAGLYDVLKKRIHG